MDLKSVIAKFGMLLIAVCCDRWVGRRHRRNLQGMLPDSEGKGDASLAVSREDRWRCHGRRISGDDDTAGDGLRSTKICPHCLVADLFDGFDQPSETSPAMGSTAAMSKMMAHCLDGNNVAGDVAGGGTKLHSSSPSFCLEPIGQSVVRRGVAGRQPCLAALDGDGAPYLGAPVVH
ncbi:hypothetical protein ACLOJK_022463 [Asimina triloba]